MSRLLACIAFGVVALAGSIAVRADTPLVQDPELRTGRLDNGLTYYIRRSEEPRDQVVLRFFVRSGSFHETKRQAQYAHLIEHMVFFDAPERQTRGSSWEQLPRLGVMIGSDARAFTGDIATSYQLEISNKNPAAWKSALDIVRRWTEARFDERDVERERLAVYEEARRSSAGSARQSARHTKLVTQNSGRDPWTTAEGMESMQRVDYEQVRRYFADWYRPDRFGVIVVGDLDPAAAEADIRQRFASLPAAGSTSVELPPVVLNGRDVVAVLTDPEEASVRVTLAYVRRPLTVRTEEQLAESLAETLIDEMFRSRYLRFPERYGAAIDGGGVLNGPGWTISLRQLSANIEVHEDRVTEALSEVLRMFNDVRRSGFTADELTTARARWLADHDPNATPTSSEIASSYSELFLSGETAMDLRARRALERRKIEALDLAMVNGLAARWLSVKDRETIVYAPESLKAALPDEQQLRALRERIDREPARPVPKAIVADLKLAPVKATAKPRIEALPAIQATHLYYADNGVNVILRPDEPTAAAKEIRLLASSTGGVQAYQGEDRRTASVAADIVVHSGLGNLDKFELGRFLTARNVHVVPYIYDVQEGIRGSAPAEEVELMLQLAHAYFTKPVRNKAAFEDWQSSRKAMLKAIERGDAKERFARLVSLETSTEASAVPAWSIAAVDAMILVSVLEIYRQRFAAAGDFVFVVTGAFSIEEIVPLLNRYVGTLPNRGKGELRTARASGYKAGAIERTIREAEENKATVNLSFAGPVRVDSSSVTVMQGVRELFQHRLMRRLREQESGVYAVLVNGNVIPQANEFRFAVEFDCQPANVERLIAATLDEIAQVRDKPIDLEEFRGVELSVRQAQEVRTSWPSFWSAHVAEEFVAARGEVKAIRPPEIKVPTAEQVRTMVREYLTPERFQRFVLLPKPQGES